VVRVNQDVGERGCDRDPAPYRAILHDSDMYDEPESFKPERFLRTNPDGSSSINPDVYDPRDAIFGYGRRMCPGKPTATALLYIAAVSILATMRVSRPTDARGAPAPMHEEWVPGILNAFAKFDCTILPRDKRAAELVREAAEMAEGQS
jgi:cytochrome P450